MTRDDRAGRVVTPSGGKRRPKRGRSLGLKPLSRIERREREELRLYLAIADEERPRTRGECFGIPRPCPFASCRFNLVVDRSRGGAALLAFPEPDEMEHSCALDLAEEGGMSLAAVGAAIGVSMEMTRLIERRALAKVGATELAREVREVFEVRPRPLSKETP